MSELSPRARDLFAAARQDGPSEESRDAMWSHIQTAGLSAGANAGASHALVKTGLASSKLVLGIALGATITVGVTAALLAIARPLLAPPTHTDRPRMLDRDEGDRMEALRVPVPVVITGHAVASTAPVSPAPASTALATAPTSAEMLELDPATKPAARSATTTLSDHDRLAREARMVSEARGALHRGDPEMAVRIVRAARALPGARLGPEELTVEAQALRAMGDEAGAQRAESDLAGKFPEQAIAH